MSLVSSRSDSVSRMRRLPEAPFQSNEQSTSPVQNVALLDLLENSSDDSMLTRALPTVRVQRKFCLLGNIRLSLVLGSHSLQRQILQTWGTFLLTFTVVLFKAS